MVEMVLFIESQIPDVPGFLFGLFLFGFLKFFEYRMHNSVTFVFTSAYYFWLMGAFRFVAFVFITQSWKLK